MDRVAREEYQSHQTRDLDNEDLQVRRDDLSHPYDWECFRFLVQRVENCIARWPEIRRIVLIGGGTGFEAAILKNRVPAIREIVVLDLGFPMLRRSAETFTHMGAKNDGTLRVLADFNSLPFRSFGNDTVGLAFRCLHHAMDIDTALGEMRQVFHRVVLLEPVWSWPIRLLARWGIANRPEHIEDHRPQRVTPSQLRAKGWLVEEIYLIEVPRNRLPGLQKREGPFRSGQVSRTERLLAWIYNLILRLGTKPLVSVGLANYVQATLVRKP